MFNELYATLEKNPIIAAIKDDEGLKKAIKSDCKVIFILYGNIVNVADIVQDLKRHGKLVFIHVDLLDGSSNNEIIVNFLKKHTNADGIISTKAPIIRAAKSHGFYTIHRIFLIDSMTFNNIEKQISISKPDYIEILPGCMPKVIKWVIDKIDLPMIASGLVCEKEDVVAALKSGVTAISSTNPSVWFM